MSAPQYVTTWSCLMRHVGDPDTVRVYSDGNVGIRTLCGRTTKAGRRIVIDRESTEEGAVRHVEQAEVDALPACGACTRVAEARLKPQTAGQAL